MKQLFQLFAVIIFLIITGCSESKQQRPTLLIFSKTEGFRHSSIEKGADVISQIAQQKGFDVVHTEDASVFNDDSLRNFEAVIFLNTTGDILDNFQQADFERYIQAGGGFIGIHAAADTEYKWPWYGKLVGGYFNGHPNNPNVREAVVRKVSEHQITDSIPEEWKRTDEWYNYRDVNPDINVLLNLDEKTYEGGDMGDDHPIAWYHEYDGGRVFYTGMGHTEETYDEQLFVKLIKNALDYVTEGVNLDYKKVSSERVPEENRFTKVVLDFNLNEPTEMAFLPDGRIIFTERKGKVKLYSHNNDSTIVINTIDVFHEEEDGLMGIAVDPDFSNNDWVYLYYSPAGQRAENRLSRFKFRNNKLALDTEQVVLTVDVQREECCHTGGSIAFDGKGNLYLSTGDNTNPFKSNGYAPIDERPGRAAWDAQKSSSNTNDLRGKVLRIHPEPDGSYTIPKGNMFAPGTPDTRPEIYAMGMRNPYRISVDAKTGFLYWGDVGPDANKNDSLRGPRGYDEVNQARKPGFFGWPYFVGNNFPYRDYNFATEKPGDYFDPEAPVNNSPNNTGLKELPAAQPAYVYYPYAPSPEFPIVRNGGRNAMAGPVYHSELYKKVRNSFPDYFDNKLFIYDWMRNWILIASMSEEGDLISLDPFVPNMNFNNMIDMAFSPSGELYVLEYGTGWFQQNIDARLSRIDYNGGNRDPQIRLASSQVIGKIPLEVSLSAKGSSDPDKDDLKYEWFIGKEKISEGPEFNYSFERDGLYLIRLDLTDSKGGKAVEEIIARAGNAPPEVSIEVEGNSTFYWGGRKVSYKVNVTDIEDGSTKNGSIPASEVRVHYDFLERGYDMTEIEQGHQRPATVDIGQQLMEGSDCKACHKVQGQSIGPSYVQVADKYKNNPKAITHLSNKIINGGSGVWGEVAMSAHPALTTVEASQIAKYILNLGKEKQPSEPLEGVLKVDKHKPENREGMYMITAIYKDRGNLYGRLESTGQLILRNTRIDASKYTEAHEVDEYGLPDGNVRINNIKDGSWIMYSDIDLTDVGSMTLGVNLQEGALAGGTVEVRTGSPEGIKVGMAMLDSNRVTIPLEEVKGKHDIYFTFKNAQAGNQMLVLLDWIEFNINKQNIKQ